MIRNKISAHGRQKPSAQHGVFVEEEEAEARAVERPADEPLTYQFGNVRGGRGCPAFTPHAHELFLTNGNEEDRCDNDDAPNEAEDNIVEGAVEETSDGGGNIRAGVPEQQAKGKEEPSEEGEEAGNYHKVADWKLGGRGLVGRRRFR